METDITAHLTTGAVIVYALEWAKRQPWLSFISASTPKMNRIASAVLAMVAAFGIDWAWQEETRQLVIAIPTATAAGMAMWEFMKQYVTQQILYDGVVQKSGQAKVTP